MADAGELFVRVRPLTTGFTSEASGPIAAAGRDLSRVFLAAFAIGGIASTVTGLVKAATQHQAAFAVLEQVTKDAGAANTVYGQSLESVLEKEARLKGFSDEDLASAFQRLVSVTHDSTKAFTDLNAAEDLARFRHIDLANAALLLAKAEQGKYTALQRVGIVVPKITTEEDALKLAHDRVTAAGGKLTEGEKEQYDSALLAAKAADAHATAQEALAIVLQRTGGAATTYAQTAAGQFARLQQDFHQFEVAIGTPLLAGLSGAAEGLGSFFTKLTASGQASAIGSQAAHDLGTGLHDLGVTAETVGPPLLSIAKAVEEVVSTIGAPALLAAYGTFKALGVVTGLAATAQAFYARAIVASQPAVIAATAENVALAASEAGVAAAGDAAAVGGLSAFARGVGALGLGAAGGPIGVAVVGLAALAGGITYLLTRQSAWDAANQATGSSLNALQTATNEQTTAVQNLTNAETKGISADIVEARNAEAVAAEAEAKQVDRLSEAIAKLGTAAIGTVPGPGRVGRTMVRASVEGPNTAAAADKFTQALAEQIAKLNITNPLLLHNVGLIEQLTADLHQVPSLVDIQLLINNKDPTAALTDVLTDISSLFTIPFLQPKTASAPLTIGQQWTKGIEDAAKEAKNDIQNPSTVNEALGAAGRAAVQALQQGMATDQTDLAQIQSNLTDAITQGAQAVDQAVQQAKQNLNTIGQSLATSIGTFIDQPLNAAAQRISDAQDKIAQAGNRLTLDQLGQEVSLPGGRQLSKDPAVALKELDALQASITRHAGAADPALAAYIQQYRSAALTVASGSLKLRQDIAAHAKQQAITQIANLTDELNKGAISVPAFDIALAKVLAKNHLTFVAAAKQDGIAFADTFAAQLTGLGLQEAALKAGPQRAGTGLAPSITRPLDTLEQTQKTIAGLASQERSKQLDESKKQTELLKKIVGARAVIGLGSLEKNPGQASARQKSLVGAGG